MSSSIETDIVAGSIGETNYFIFNAGSFFTDGGSAYGVLPKVIWSKDTHSDIKNRIELACNLLLINSQGRNILVDTGLGCCYDEKIAKIHTPQPSVLLKTLEKLNLSRNDIDTVILTHLHHDHIGGLIREGSNGFELTFPQAGYYIQKAEWETALNPDELNSAAYRYRLPIDLLDKDGELKLITGNYKLNNDIDIIFTGGHTVGSQMVRVSNSQGLLYYPGDIIPQKYHLNIAVTSAYDINRKETATAKKMVLDELKDKDGTIVFNHQIGQKITKY